jgi:hypothetical protein
MPAGLKLGTAFITWEKWLEAYACCWEQHKQKRKSTQGGRQVLICCWF